MMKLNQLQVQAVDSSDDVVVPRKTPRKQRRHRTKSLAKFATLCQELTTLTISEVLIKFLKIRSVRQNIVVPLNLVTMYLIIIPPK